MELINELESAPRGVYTGAIGIIGPGRRARFSVAIRTAVVDRAAGTVEYGVGSGVVWDSGADDEYRECVLKARVLSRRDPDFDLLETMLWDPETGFRLLESASRSDGRRGRVLRSDIRAERIGMDLERRASIFGDRRHRVRLLVAADGSHRIEAVPISIESATAPVRLGLAAAPVAAEIRFSTSRPRTARSTRAPARSRPDCDDVLLWNEKRGGHREHHLQSRRQDRR